MSLFSRFAAGRFRRVKSAWDWTLQRLPGRQLPHSSLIEFTRSIRFYLRSGMMLYDAMVALSQRGSRRIRRIAAELASKLEQGYSFEDAIQQQSGVFPPLFVALTAVGEESGNLPEVMADLEKYFDAQSKLRRELVAEISWPLFQMIAAIFVVAGLIFILGFIQPPGTPIGKIAVDPLGWGLIGEEGAIRFLTIVACTVAAMIGLFYVLKLALRRRAILEHILLTVPLLGGCLRAIALSRFSFALQLMLNTGASVLRSLQLAFTATDNAAFINAAPKAQALLKRGNSINSGLVATRIFPSSFLSALSIGEESGHLPEVLEQQREYYEEMTRLRMGMLNRVLGILIWIFIAGFIIYVIFQIFQTGYMNLIKQYSDKI